MSNNSATLNPHRISIIDPAEYTHVGSFYRGPSEAAHEAYQDSHAELADRYGDNWANLLVFHRNYGCAHCGAIFNHGAVFSHAEHGLIAVGWTCAKNTLDMDSRLTMLAERARKAMQEAAKAQKFADKFAAQMADAGLTEAIAFDHYIIRDIASKGRRYGSISERQMALVAKIHGEELAKIAAGPAAEPVKVAVPEYPGRVTIEGTVINTKWVESHYGSTLKMLVEVAHEGGFYRVYGTVPSSIDPDRGDVVRFDATIERSGRDESFGFFSRPSKALVIEG